jgi:hypothetical protein
MRPRPFKNYVKSILRRTGLYHPGHVTGPALPGDLPPPLAFSRSARVAVLIGVGCRVKSKS